MKLQQKKQKLSFLKGFRKIVEQKKQLDGKNHVLLLVNIYSIQSKKKTFYK